jgi:dephospho-CoA kinase
MATRTDHGDGMRELVAQLRRRGVRVIGVIGGVASGKTTVRESLERLGAGVLDGDRAAHQVLREDDVKAAIHRRWGDSVLDTAGEVDRRRVAEIVFAPDAAAAAELRFLEDLTHPRIGARLSGEARRLADDGARLIVLDAAVMEKSGWDQLCDTLVYVDADRQTRLARALARGWTEDDFDVRESAQESLQVRRGRADVVIDNSGSLGHTQAQVERVVADLID